MVNLAKLFNMFGVRCSVAVRLLKFTVHPYETFKNWLRAQLVKHIFLSMDYFYSKPVGLLHKESKILL